MTMPPTTMNTDTMPTAMFEMASGEPLPQTDDGSEAKMEKLSSRPGPEVAVSPQQKRVNP